jgi:hypothetical protein
MQTCDRPSSSWLVNTLSALRRGTQSSSSMVHWHRSQTSQAGYDWLVTSTTTRWEVVGSNPVVGQDLGSPAKMASKTPLEVLSAPSELPGENLGEGLNLQHQRCAGDRRYCALPQGAGWWVAAAKESSPRKVWTPSRGSMVAVLSLMTLRLRRRSFFLSFRRVSGTVWPQGKGVQGAPVPIA